MIKITIITVTYNNPLELKRSLLSICDGVAESNISKVEVIIVDGGTPNFTIPEISMPFATKVVSERDGGVFDAMNKGIELACGEFIIFLNSGDMFSGDDTLNNLVANVEELEPRYNGISGKVKLVFENYENISDHAPWFNHQSVVVRSSVLREYMFDAELKYFGDLDLWMRLKNNGDLVIKRIDLVVALFEMGGQGNNPAGIFARLRERNSLSDSRGETVVRSLKFVLLWVIYKVFGARGYYKIIMSR